MSFCRIYYCFFNSVVILGAHGEARHRRSIRVKSEWQTIRRYYLYLLYDLLQRGSHEWVFPSVIRVYRDPADRREKRWDWLNYVHPFEKQEPDLIDLETFHNVMNPRAKMNNCACASREMMVHQGSPAEAWVTKRVHSKCFTCIFIFHKHLMSMTVFAWDDLFLTLLFKSCSFQVWRGRKGNR